jgi:hypothetical protein
MLDIIIDFDKGPEKIRLYNVLKGLKGKNVIQIKKWRKKRSVNQNAFLWGVVYRYVSDETGFTKEESHQEMARMFLSYQKTMPNGSIKEFVRSTTELETMELEAYIAQIKNFMLENFSCLIPEPNQVINND